MGARTTSRAGLVLAALALLSCACGTGLLGGLESVSPDDAAVLQAAQFALAEYNKASNDLYVSKMIRIVSAQQQLVSGIKYFLEVEVGRTQCRKGEADDLDSCDFHAVLQKKLCSFEVYSIPWTQSISHGVMMCRPSNN